MTELKSFVTIQDLHNLGTTMHVLALLQGNQPALRDHLKAEILPAVLEVIQSPLLHTAALEGIQEFLARFCCANDDAAENLVAQLSKLLVRTSRSIPTAEDGGTQAFANVAKCIGTAVDNAQAGVSTKQFNNSIMVCTRRAYLAQCTADIVDGHHCRPERLVPTPTCTCRCWSWERLVEIRKWIKQRQARHWVSDQISFSATSRDPTMCIKPS